MINSGASLTATLTATWAGLPEKLDSIRETLLGVQERLAFLKIDVDLREPLDEELEETRAG